MKYADWYIPEPVFPIMISLIDGCSQQESNRQLLTQIYDYSISWLKIALWTQTFPLSEKIRV
jgi:hypothetical protein